tara:strand:+ start:188 stop:349 length:162 start_codon:yes stop_codon:yes gene_type:complete
MFGTTYTGVPSLVDVNIYIKLMLCNDDTVEYHPDDSLDLEDEYTYTEEYTYEP